jgi:competence CoiA-like predicted nuclease
VRTARPAKLAYLSPEGKKMSTDIDQKNKKSLFSVSGLLARTLIYSGFCMGIIASLYDFKLNSFVVSSTESSKVEPKVEQYINSIEAEQYMNSLNKAQEAYYDQHGKFSDSIENLRIKNQKQRDYYTYKILSSIGPIQPHYYHREPVQFESTIAIATPPNRGHKSYTGAVFVFPKNVTFRNKVSIRLRTKSVICESNRVNLIPPTFDGGQQIRCPPGTNILR